MRDLSRISNPYRDDKVIDSCSLFGVIDLEGRRFPPKAPIKAMDIMSERVNGLGAGFAGYGIYPEYRDAYALHVMFMGRDAKGRTEEFLKKNLRVLMAEEMPTGKEMRDAPLIWRYFVEPKIVNDKCSEDSDNQIVECVMKVNNGIEGAYIFSSGKDMGVFKGVGYPSEIAEYFCLDEYEGYMWICHGRFPTNTPGWWGGAHPFNILDWSVAHNGELSSYGTNRNFLEMYGYRCTMQTDTEVIAYALDLLVRRHKIPIGLAAKILAPPFWNEIDSMDSKERTLYATLRQVYGGLLMNGPFSIIIARSGEMMGLADRIKLRPLTAAIKDNLLYLSSEEAAVRSVSPSLDRVWNLRGGELLIGRLRSVKTLEIPPVVGLH